MIIIPSENKQLFFVKIPTKLMLHPRGIKKKDVTISEISVKIWCWTNIAKKIFSCKSVTSEKALKSISSTKATKIMKLHSTKATKYHEVTLFQSKCLRCLGPNSYHIWQGYYESSHSYLFSPLLTKIGWCYVNLQEGCTPLINKTIPE